MSTLTDSQTLLAFKAGRSFRRANTHFVDAQSTKGALVLSASIDEGLLRLEWKERPSGNTHEDLILFPGDARLEKVSQDRSERTYVLKFESSDHKHFVRPFHSFVCLCTSLLLANNPRIHLVLDAGKAYHSCTYFIG